MKKLVLLGMVLAMILSVAPAMAADADVTAQAKETQFEALSLVPTTDTALTPMTETELEAVEGKGLILVGNVNVSSQSNYAGYCLLCGGVNVNYTSQRFKLVVVKIGGFF